MYKQSLCSKLCSDGVSHPNFGIIGKNYDQRRIMFVLHRSDSRALEDPVKGDIGLFAENPIGSEDPYDRALRKSDTGRLLNWFFGFCGINKDDIYLTNFFKCHLPKNREPRHDEYLSCLDIMREQIRKAEPKKLVVFGAKPCEYMFPEFEYESFRHVGYTQYDGISSMVLMHPRRLHGLHINDRQRYFVEIRNFLLKG